MHLQVLLLGNMALAALRMKEYSSCVDACDQGWDPIPVARPPHTVMSMPAPSSGLFHFPLPRPVFVSAVLSQSYDTSHSHPLSTLPFVQD